MVSSSNNIRNSRSV